jgi:glycosyltransferase involved in cell wall biosynthesis
MAGTMVAARRSCMVLVDTLHSSHAGRLGRQIGYWCSRWLTDQITAVSRATATSHLAAGMVDNDRLTIIENGIDVDVWRPDQHVREDFRRALGLTDEFLWISVGRLETVKGFPALLEAMARLPRPARLVVLGEGTMHDELVAMVAQLGLERRVCLIGFEPDVKRWMQAADGFVLASRYEGLPMVLLEAGACGVPAVATDVAGTREVIVHGETGWLAHPSDAKALAAAMTKLMDAPVVARHAMSERARSRIVERFNLENVLDKWEQLYSELVARGQATWRNRLMARKSLNRRSAASA